MKRVHACLLHLSRSTSPFPPRISRNTHQNSYLRTRQGRALHLSRFPVNPLFYKKFENPITSGCVTTLSQKRGNTGAEPLHLSRPSVASLRENAISAFPINNLPSPPVFLPVVTCISFFARDSG